MRLPQAMLFAVLVCAVQTGCMHRRMTIRSNPPGALAMLDGKELGYTPVSADFTYYGTREITLIKDGFEPLTVYQDVRTPWYQVFPLDFVTDNFVPGKITDRREFAFQLKPRVLAPTRDLIERGNSLRSEAALGL